MLEPRRDVMAENDRFGVLLTDYGWAELGEVLKPYVQTGPIGKYISSNGLTFDGAFLHLSFTPSQVQGRIASDMEIYIPLAFVKFVATNVSENSKKIGFA